jgi:hypothetical protein
MKIMVGLWYFSGGSERAQERIGAVTDAAATTLAEAIANIRRLAQSSLLETKETT